MDPCHNFSQDDGEARASRIHKQNSKLTCNLLKLINILDDLRGKTGPILRNVKRTKSKVEKVWPETCAIAAELAQLDSASSEYDFDQFERFRAIIEKFQRNVITLIAVLENPGLLHDISHMGLMTREEKLENMCGVLPRLSVSLLLDVLEGSPSNCDNAVPAICETRPDCQFGSAEKFHVTPDESDGPGIKPIDGLTGSELKSDLDYSMASVGSDLTSSLNVSEAEIVNIENSDLDGSGEATAAEILDMANHEVTKGLSTLQGDVSCSASVTASIEPTSHTDSVERVSEVSEGPDQISNSFSEMDSSDLEARNEVAPRATSVERDMPDLESTLLGRARSRSACHGHCHGEWAVETVRVLDAPVLENFGSDPDALPAEVDVNVQGDCPAATSRESDHRVSTNYVEMKAKVSTQVREKPRLEDDFFTLSKSQPVLVNFLALVLCTTNLLYVLCGQPRKKRVDLSTWASSHWRGSLIAYLPFLMLLRMIVYPMKRKKRLGQFCGSSRCVERNVRQRATPRTFVLAKPSEENQWVKGIAIVEVWKPSMLGAAYHSRSTVPL
jgi:hypothetical protein